MGRKLSDILLLSDVDGTFFNEGHPFPQRNLDAVLRFTQKGGRFAFATGRSVLTIRSYFEAVGGNMPCIVNNGGSIYDLQANRFLWHNVLPPTAAQYLGEILQQYPEFTVFIIVEEEYACVHQGRAAHHVRPTVLTYRTPEEMVGRPWYKLLFAMEADRIPEVRQHWMARYPDVDFMQSSPIYLEMLPKGISKGTALQVYAGMFGLDLANVAAIGDLYNDLAMLQLAGIPGAPSDAAPEVRAAAQRVFCRCDEGAVADFVEYIESLCE